MIRVLFFAQLRERLQTDSLDMPECANVAELRQALSERGDIWQEVMQSERCLAAVNQVLCDNTQALNTGDEVAFFPPVTGG